MGCPEFPSEYYDSIRNENPLVIPFPVTAKNQYKPVFHTVPHDPMGNRTSAALYDSVTGEISPVSYNSNELNQYTEIYNPDKTGWSNIRFRVFRLGML